MLGFKGKLCLLRISKLTWDHSRSFLFRERLVPRYPIVKSVRHVEKIETLVVRLNPYPEIHSYFVKKPFQIFHRCISSEVTADANKKSTIALRSKKRPHKKATTSIDKDPNRSSWAVYAHSTAEEYDLEALMSGLTEQGLYQQSAMPEDMNDAIHVSAKYQLGREPREVYFFREGSVVFWNVPEIERTSVLNFLKNYQCHPYNQELVIEEIESLDYLYTDNKTRLTSGTILLNHEGSTDLEKYAFSNGMAQSVKLAIWEATLDRFVESIEWITGNMKENKNLKLTQKEVFSKTGELFSLRHLINLSSDLLDTPDFYWDRQNLESLYQKMCNHLNIAKRTRVMNEKLSHCCELMELLNSHLSDKHHVRLEWMIIVLIMVEVLFEFIHYAERFLH